MTDQEWEISMFYAGCACRFNDPERCAMSRVHVTASVRSCDCPCHKEEPAND